MLLQSEDHNAVQTTCDDFLGGALQLHQPASGYRAGLDAILLAAACSAASGERVIDCGAGVGAVGLAVARRVAGAAVTLVEREATLSDLARRNVSRNGLADRCIVVAADIAAKLSSAPELAVMAGQFDHAVANPPYYAHARGTRATDTLKDASHAMAGDSLEAWVKFAASMTRAGGTFTMVHRADALPELLAALNRRFGGTSILPIHPRPGEPASRLLVRAIKASRAPLTVLAGRVLHQDAAHAFTPEFDAILRHGAPLIFQ